MMVITTLVCRELDVVLSCLLS